jgi:hypothetical protein
MLSMLSDVGFPQYTHRPIGEESKLELELIQTCMIQKPLLWVEVGKGACVLVGICELRLSLPAAPCWRRIKKKPCRGIMCLGGWWYW